MAQADSQSFGAAAEQAAADYLRRQGYRILCHNYRTRLGEIDLIATDHRTLCFVEVKGKRSAEFGPPETAVTAPKQQRLRRAAMTFLASRRLTQTDCRFDVVTVLPSPAGEGYQFELIRNAF